MYKKFFCFLFVTFFLFTNNKAFSQNNRYGGTLYLYTISDPKSFNPIIAKETSTTAITRFLFEGLTTIDGITGEVKPHLALSWEIAEDGKTFVFKLREDVKWFDGKSFTADDVVFTFNQLIYNPAIPNSAADIFKIGGKPFQIEKIDTYSVKFTLSAPFAPFLRSMSQEILPKHILEKFVTEQSFNTVWGVDTVLAEVIGNGSFKLEKYEPGQMIVLRKNSLYWKKDNEGNRLPYIEKIVFIILKNEDMALLKFLEGKIDYYGLRGSDFPILKPKESTGDFIIYRTGPVFSSSFLFFNLNDELNSDTGENFIPFKKLEWFSNLNFRKAVAHAMDKQSMIDIVLNGLGSPQDSALSPAATIFYNPDVRKYQYDLKKAKDILKEAGFFDRNGDGFLEDKEGNTLEFNLFTNSNSTERVEIAGIILEDLKKIGLKVNFVQLEFNTLVTKLTSTYDWDAILLGLTGGIEPHFGANIWLSSGGLHMWHPKQKTPATSWEKRIDEIFEEGVSELNIEKRKKLYNEWQAIIADKVPFIYTVLPENIMAIRKKFGNLKPTAIGGAFHNIEEIYIKQE